MAEVEAVRGAQQGGNARLVFKHTRCGCCGPLGSFLLVASVILPILIFMVSAFFAIPLWALECGDDSDLCSYYEWCATCSSVACQMRKWLPVLIAPVFASACGGARVRYGLCAPLRQVLRLPPSRLTANILVVVAPTTNRKHRGLSC